MTWHYRGGSQNEQRGGRVYPGRRAQKLLAVLWTDVQYYVTALGAWKPHWKSLVVASRGPDPFAPPGSTPYPLSKWRKNSIQCLPPPHTPWRHTSRLRPMVCLYVHSPRYAAIIRRKEFLSIYPLFIVNYCRLLSTVHQNWNYQSKGKYYDSLRYWFIYCSYVRYSKYCTIVRFAVLHRLSNRISGIRCDLII